jgi:hypothetical protein
MTVISVITIIILFCACNTKYQNSIYSDDAKIAKEGDSYYSQMRLATEVKTSDGIKKTISFGTFIGDETIFIANAKKDSTVNINVDSEIKSGNFKLVIVEPDKKVTVLTTGTKECNSELKIKKGQNRFKIVGKSAKGK